MSAAAGPILTTARLSVREIAPSDAPFILALLNDPGFIANIADRGVRTAAEAERYIAERFASSYASHGYGFYLVESADGPIGICGFVSREGFPAPDLGFAYLADHVGRGYGREAGEAMLRHGRDVLGLDPIVAFTKPGNAASAALLRRLGFVEEGLRELPGYPGGSLLFRHASPAAADRLGGAASPPQPGKPASP